MQLLDDTLDVTRLEQGRIHVELGRMSLPQVVRECIQMVQPSARAREIDLQLDIEDRAEAAGDCVADSRRLKQVVCNLLTNAIKFTPNHGKVQLGLALEQPPAPRTMASREGAASDGAVLGTATSAAAANTSAASPMPFLLTVRDTGIGIQADDIELVFLKYTKVHHMLP